MVELLVYLELERKFECADCGTVYLEAVRKTTKNLSEGILFPEQDLNPGPPMGLYEAAIIIT
jgi:hypothetical protein